MSGRMLYQRSGMSLSLRRVFFVTSPSLLNPFGRCPSERVALASWPWTPAPVPALPAPADQLQPRARAVGPARGRLPAAALKLHGPGHRNVLVGGGMQRPVRV